MKISRLPVTCILVLLMSLSGCFPYKPQTLWFKADPPKLGVARTFYIELSDALVAGDTEEKRRAEVIDMAEFWSRSQEPICPHGITPIEYGYIPDKQRYWLTASCKSEI